MNQTRPASLLIVLAHPDDEIFHGGVLAHLSERGVRVTLACATDGEAGKAHPSLGQVDDLGAVRVDELRLSCARLGIEEPLLLRFHDSARKERQRHDDPHALVNVDMLDVEAAIRGIIADVKPHVIVTVEPHGGYYHPDHLAIQRATTAAFFSSSVMGSEAPERLFYANMLTDVFRRLADASRAEASSRASTLRCSRRGRRWSQCHLTRHPIWSRSSPRGRPTVRRSASRWRC